LQEKYKKSYDFCNLKLTFIRIQRTVFKKNNLHWFKKALSLVDLLIENKAEEAKTLISSMLKEFFKYQEYCS
jgi:hypothetical protein